MIKFLRNRWPFIAAVIGWGSGLGILVGLVGMIAFPASSGLEIFGFSVMIMGALVAAEVRVAANSEKKGFPALLIILARLFLGH